MKKLLACMAAATLGFAGHADASVIATGSYAAGVPTDIVVGGPGSFFPPGTYSYQLDFTAPIAGFLGGLYKDAYADDYCYDAGGGISGLCGGGPMATQVLFSESSPGHYAGTITAIMPYTKPQPFGYTNYYDDCCGVFVSFTGVSAGNFTLSMVTDATGTPEPEAWALMTLGFGVVGMTLRRREARSALSQSTAA